MERLRLYELFAKKEKCSFGLKQIRYLGHAICEKGVAIGKDKITASLNWPLPKSVKGIRGLLGLAGYYRKFTKNYEAIAAPLPDLLKEYSYQWDQLGDSFNNLKQALTAAPAPG